MGPIKLIDKDRVDTDFEYTIPEANRNVWTGRFAVVGKVTAFMCGHCGRIVLYGQEK
jgi:hypothetical protein